MHCLFCEQTTSGVLSTGLSYSYLYYRIFTCIITVIKVRYTDFRYTIHLDRPSAVKRIIYERSRIHVM